MKVYQVGNKLYQSEAQFRNKVFKADPDSIIRIYELKSELSVKSFLRDTKIDSILNEKEDHLREIRNWALKKAEIILERNKKIGVNNLMSLYDRYRLAETLRKFKYLSEKEIKGVLSSKGKDIMDICDSIEDFKTILKVHNYKSFKYKRQWLNGKTYTIENENDKLFFEAKKELALEKQK